MTEKTTISKIPTSSDGVKKGEREAPKLSKKAREAIKKSDVARTEAGKKASQIRFG